MSKVQNSINIYYIEPYHLYDLIDLIPNTQHNVIPPPFCTKQLGAAASFDNLVKFGDYRQIRRFQMFIKLGFEWGCDVILMSHPVIWSLGGKLP